MTFSREEPETSTHSTTVSFSLPKQRHSPCFSVSATLQVTMDCLEPQLQGHTMNKAVSALKESTIWSLGWYAKTSFYSAGKETQSITNLLCHGVWVSSLKRNTSGWVLPIYLCNMWRWVFTTPESVQHYWVKKIGCIFCKFIGRLQLLRFMSCTEAFMLYNYLKYFKSWN